MCEPLSDDLFLLDDDDVLQPVEVDTLSDEQLLYYYDRLHTPSLIATEWIETLQREVLRRGLRQFS